MKTSKKFLFNIILVGLLLPLISCVSQSQSGSSSEAERSVPKNIILLIGDGMSYPQITATKYAHGNLAMSSMPYTGSLYTRSTDGKVTDSAAGATALAAGYKTNNGFLGVLPDTSSVQSIAHYAQELGKTTALLATSRITHATPAGFAIHHPNRGEEIIIAEKYVNSGIDILMGAGSNYFLPESEGGIRSDDRNLITEMEEMGYSYVNNLNDLSQLSSDQNKVVAFLEGGDLGPAPERGDQLGQLTEAALAKASQDEDGFFMMIEGSQIDWAGHANEAEWMMQEVLDFDRVIARALEFAEEDGNTLVLVTADHETGGLTLPSEDYVELNYNFSTGGHTALHVPIFAYGPSGDRFVGVYDNTEIARKMFSIWGKEIQD